MIRYPLRAAAWVAFISKGKKDQAILVWLTYYTIFNVLEAGVELVFFGHMFVHGWDKLFGALFIVWLVMILLACISYVDLKRRKT